MRGEGSEGRGERGAEKTVKDRDVEKIRILALIRKTQRQNYLPRLDPKRKIKGRQKFKKVIVKIFRHGLDSTVMPSHAESIPAAAASSFATASAMGSAADA
jgi:hypothetical protein